ncbi:MAG: discoidin domain-containing protein, partial [Bacteroidales bacterium]
INNIEAYYTGDECDIFNTKVEKIESYPFTLIGVNIEEAKKASDKDPLTTCFIDANTVLIDLGEEQNVTSFHYLPDQSEYNKGLISNYELYVGSQIDTVSTLVSKGEFSNIRNNPILQSVYFTPVKGRYIMLKAVRMVNSEEPMGFADICIK